MSELWSTPRDIFDKLDAEFHFVLDVCALPGNAKCEEFYTPEMDGLVQLWRAIDLFNQRPMRPSIWMNPPYGKGIEKWLEKAFLTSLHGHRVVALIPSRTNAPWWHDYVMRASEIRFVKHKLAFDIPQTEEYSNQKKGVPFTGAVIVVFDGEGRPTPHISTWIQPKHEAQNITIRGLQANEV